MLAYGYAFSTWLFLKLLAVIYAIAFVSLAVQMRGLIGSRGIVPVSLLRRAHLRGALGGFFAFPTLSRWVEADAALVLQCWFGLAGAVALFSGVCPPLALLLCWFLYVSLSNAGGMFLGYQWDALLAEMGLLAVLIAPPFVWIEPATLYVPPAAAHLLLLWLLFRLVFSSGVAKLASGDVTWRTLSALDVHFETQPLPNTLSWHAHHLPRLVKRAGVAVTIAVEVASPFLLLAPPTFRYAGLLAIVALMIAIEATGNYGFFNLQTIALCVLAVDDRVLNALLPGPSLLTLHAAPLWWAAVVTLASACLFALSLLPLILLFARREALPRMLVQVWRRFAPWRMVNGYGLFAVMTTSRPEIVIEGSDDGNEWRAYEFRWKPGDPKRRPRTVAPHQPRLDWQLWFAALGGLSSAPWLRSLLDRLLEASPPVLALFADDPFHGRPPAYVRAHLYSYRFTSVEERARTGDWWSRELIGDYYPAVTLYDADVLDE